MSKRATKEMIDTIDVEIEGPAPSAPPALPAEGWAEDVAPIAPAAIDPPSRDVRLMTRGEIEGELREIGVRRRLLLRTLRFIAELDRGPTENGRAEGTRP